MRSFASLRMKKLTRGDGAVGGDGHRLRDIALGRGARPLTVVTAPQVLDVLVVQRLEMRLHARGSRQVGGRGLDLRGGSAGKAQHGQNEKKRSHPASLPFRT